MRRYRQNYCFRIYLLFVGLVCLGFHAKVKKTERLEGKINGAKDGNNYVILIDKSPITIQLAHIDCPEKKQAYDQPAKKLALTFVLERKSS
jgi:micrococcal nuclease